MGTVFSSSSSDSTSTTDQTDAPASKRQKVVKTITTTTYTKTSPAPSASSSGTSSSEPKLCATCNEELTGSYTNALGKTYHLDCFQCDVCHIPVRSVRFHHVDGKVYCPDDYDKYANRNIETCAVCYERVLPREGQKSVESTENVYHSHCFKCSKCNTVLKAGEEYYTKKNKRGPDNPHAGIVVLFCGKCGAGMPTAPRVIIRETIVESKDSDVAVSKETSTPRKASAIAAPEKQCDKCKKSIVGNSILHKGIRMHIECHCCVTCKKPFYENSFWTDHDGKTYCRLHYPYPMQGDVMVNKADPTKKRKI